MPYESIVIGTDGSETAARARKVASELARAIDATLVIVSGYEEPDPLLVEEWKRQAPKDMWWKLASSAVADEVVLKASKVAAAEGTKVETQVQEGNPADILIDVAATKGAGLIVVGNKGMASGKRFLLGSVPNRVSHHAPCDVLIVRTVEKREKGLFENMLIGTDGSNTASKALEKAYTLAGATGAKPSVIFVGEPDKGRAVLKEASERGPGEIETFLEEGNPAEKICDTAESKSFDLIVIGNKGMTGARRFLLGTVPNQVSHYSPTDTLIVKTT